MGGLVLTRRKSERIQIGPDIIITITEIRPSRVKIHIEAPKTLDINRLRRHEIEVRKDGELSK